MIQDQKDNNLLRILYRRIFHSAWYKKFKHSRLEPFIEKVIHPDTSPYTTATSMAAGTFIGIFIPVGFQLATTVIISPIKYINFLITSITTLISNPFTVLPIYAFGIKVGEFVMNRAFPWPLFKEFVNHPAFKTLVNFGSEGIWILMTGLLVMAVPATIIVFFSSLAITKKIRRKIGLAG